MIRMIKTTAVFEDDFKTDVHNGNELDSMDPITVTFKMQSNRLFLSPHWGPKDPSGVQSRLHVRLYFSLSVRLSVSLFGHPRRFLRIIRAARKCVQRMWTHATGSNPLSGIIKYPSIRPVVYGPFLILVFVLFSSVGVQRRDTFIY